MPLNIDYEPRQGRVARREACPAFSPPPPLSHWIHSFWQLTVDDGAYRYRSIPDNCVDWIVNAGGPDDNSIVAPFFSPVIFDLQGPVVYFGIRFRVLGQQGLIRTPLGEWAAAAGGIPAAAVVPDAILHAVSASISGAPDFAGRCKRVSAVLLGVLQQPRVDPRLARFIRSCSRDPASDKPVCDRHSTDFALSARQLRRLSHLHLGLSPGKFARVMRFQHTLGRMSDGRSPAARAAWSDCCCDQPHFIREFKALAGLTPGALLTSSVLYKQGDAQPRILAGTTQHAERVR